MPNALDPALRRPGRFDRELELPAPSAEERARIFAYCCHQLPLDSSVNLAELAQTCVGYVGADIAALCREAAMLALRSSETSRQKSESKSQSELQPQTQTQTESISSATTKVHKLHFSLAQKKILVSSRRGFEVDFQRTQWSDVGGLEEIKSKLIQSVEWPLLHAETFIQLGIQAPRGILLHGPPGCSKTTLVKAMATSTHSAFLSMNGALVYSAYLGEAELNIRRLFSRARANRPCIIFLDEIDALVGKRSLSGAADSQTAMEKRILSTLLNEMDGIQLATGVLVVGATNRLDMLDAALLRPGRFDHIIYVRLLDRLHSVSHPHPHPHTRSPTHFIVNASGPTT